MKRFLSISLVLCLPILTSACAAPINRYLVDKYAQAAYVSSQQGDWRSAGRQWARAVNNADLGNMKKKDRAVFYYEYGRATGVTCYFDIAEEYLNKAYALDLETGGPAYTSLVELFRLNLDQKKYDKAVEYFKKALPEFDKINVSKTSPAEYSVLLDEYSRALNEIGNTEEAQKVKSEAAKFKDTAEHSITERTPYGLYCEDSKK